MIKEERLAFDFGKTFDASFVPAGYPIAVCYDKRMYDLVSEARSERGHQRNQRNMAAWYRGLQSKEVPNVPA